MSVFSGIMTEVSACGTGSVSVRDSIRASPLRSLSPSATSIRLHPLKTPDARQVVKASVRVTSEYTVCRLAMNWRLSERLADLVQERIGGRISEGTIMKVIVEFAASCSSAISKIREYLISAAVKGADETGMRTDGILY